MLATIIASVALVLIVVSAVRHLYLQRKRGSACAGCSLETKCPIIQAYSGGTPNGVEPLPVVNSGCGCGCG